MQRNASPKASSESYEIAEIACIKLQGMDEVMVLRTSEYVHVRGSKAGTYGQVPSSPELASSVAAEDLQELVYHKSRLIIQRASAT